MEATATEVSTAPVPLWRRITQGLAAVRPLDLRTGHWFDRVVARYLRSRPARPVPFATPATRRRASCAIVRRNATEAAVLGAATATVSTAAALLTADTQGYGGVVALPLAAGAMAAEMVARAVLHVRMSCAIGDVWGVRFSPDDPGDVARLYALAFDVEEPKDDAAGGRDVVERLARAREGDLGAAIGAKLISETLLRNLLPFVGIVTSAVASWRLTMRVGNGVTRYLGFRHALDGVLARVQAHDPGALDALIEGVWFVASADGQVNDDEAALLAHLVRMRPREARWKLTARFVADEGAWLDRLARLPEAVHAEVLTALEVAAAMDGVVSPPERTLLARAAAALGLEPSPERLDVLARTFADDGGEVALGAAVEGPRTDSGSP